MRGATCSTIAEHVPQRPRRVQAPDRPAARHPADGRPPADAAVQEGLQRDRGLVARSPAGSSPSWRRSPRSCPELEDVIVDGRSCLEMFTSGTDDNLEDLLLAAERVSLENRLDLMNDRAQLYDAWRQIRVTANALKGVLQRHRHQPDPHPAGHDQPVRLPRPGQAVLPRAQRRAAAGADGRAEQLPDGPDQLPAPAPAAHVPRGLPEAPTPWRHPRACKSLICTYEISKRNFVLYARQKDQAFENIVAPPMSGSGGAAAGAEHRHQRLGRHPDQQPDPAPEQPDRPREQPRHPVVWLPGCPPDRLPRPRHLALRRMGGLL